MPSDLTKKRYLNQLNNFKKSDADIDSYIRSLDRKSLSKFKRSLEILKAEKMDQKFTNEIDFLINKCLEERKNTKKYHKNKKEPLKLKNVENSINRMKNIRNKLAFRLQMISGLRIAELSNIEFNNIRVTKEGRLLINVINGKYSKDRLINCLPDKWVLDNLIELKPKNNGKMFNSKEYLMKLANRLNFQSHDLRKVYARGFYYNSLESPEDTLKLLAENMGHKDIKETFVYLNREINEYNSKIEKVKPFTKSDLTQSLR
jgi:integrase